MTELDQAQTGSPSQYWNARLSEHWGPHGVGALACGIRYNRWLYRVRRRAFRERCRTLNANIQQARVLDIGSGTGFYLEEWIALDAKCVTGLDFTATAIERLERLMPSVQLLQADIGAAATPLDRQSFDIVSAMDVLFHIVDDQRYTNALRNIHDCLTSKGYLLYSDNFLHGPTTQYENYFKARSLDEVTRAMDRVGFDIVSRSPVFTLMNSPVDSGSAAHDTWWRLLSRFVARSELAGFIAGASLYPAEILLRKLIREGPSTEIMLCRKRE